MHYNTVILYNEIINNQVETMLYAMIWYGMVCFEELEYNYIE